MRKSFAFSDKLAKVSVSQINEEKFRFLSLGFLRIRWAQRIFCNFIQNVSTNYTITTLHQHNRRIFLWCFFSEASAQRDKWAFCFFVAISYKRSNGFFIKQKNFNVRFRFTKKKENSFVDKRRKIQDKETIKVHKGP